MALPKPRRLIVNADDYGLSDSVNRAVLDAHLNGVLTSASLMVCGPAFAEAADAARRRPSLGVGLHLVFTRGRAALDSRQAPGLVDCRGEFLADPVRAGLRYFWKPSLRAQLKLEMEAQFDRFEETELPLDHVNGHLNIHLHPTLLNLLLDVAETRGVRAIRLTRDPFFLNARLAGGRWRYRASHALVFALLARRARGRLRRRGVRFVPRVFGLLQDSRVDEAFLTRLISRLPAGDSELYCHPSTEEFKHEWDALTSVSIRKRIAGEGIRLLRYQDLDSP